MDWVFKEVKIYIYRRCRLLTKMQVIKQYTILIHFSKNYSYIWENYTGVSVVIFGCRLLIFLFLLICFSPSYLQC